MCGKNTMRVLGGTLTLLYLAVGLTFFVVGFTLQVAPASSMMIYIKPYVDQLNILVAPGKAQFDPYDFIEDLPMITGNVAAAFIAMGAVQSIIGVIGLVALCGARRRPILTAFFIIMILMIATQIALIILYYALRGPISNQAKVVMQKSINEKFSGYNVTNMETVLWNVFHVSLNCCGINGGQDFEKAQNWPRVVKYGPNIYNPVAKPLTCCKTDNYTACLLTNHTNLAYTNQDKGCWGPIQNIMDTNMVYAALGTGALVILEVLLLAFSASICYSGRMKPKALDFDQPAK